MVIKKNSKDKIKCVGLVQSGYRHFIECILFSPWYSWKLLIWRKTTITHSLLPSSISEFIDNAYINIAHA